MREIGPEYLYGGTKRRFDIAGGTALAVLGIFPAALALPTAAAASHSRHPLFFQERVGQGGKLLRLPKFRTIRDDKVTASSNMHYGTIDPRASAAGNVLRATGADELPQIYYILTGDMSLVGHRPPTMQTLERYNSADSVLFADWYDGVVIANKPGYFSQSVSHRKQVADPYTPTTIIATMRNDLEYCETASLRCDLQTIAETSMVIGKMCLKAIT